MSGIPALLDLHDGSAFDREVGQQRDFELSLPWRAICFQCDPFERYALKLGRKLLNCDKMLVRVFVPAICGYSCNGLVCGDEVVFKIFMPVIPILRFNRTKERRKWKRTGKLTSTRDRVATAFGGAEPSSSIEFTLTT